MPFEKINSADVPPCPFCDRLPVNVYTYERDKVFSVVCSCGAAGPYGATKAEALEKWSK